MALKVTRSQARRLERNLAGQGRAGQKTKDLTGDIMTVTNAVAARALELAGVSRIGIAKLFLETPEFSSFRLAKCRELARKIAGVKVTRRAGKQ